MFGRGSLVGLWVVTLVGALVLPARGAGLPTDWTNADIGSPDTMGSTVYDSAKGTWTVTGSGNDIWGAQDQFQYAYTKLKGDGNVTARILSQDGGNPAGWSRNGLMIREGEAADARHFIMALGNIPAVPGGTGSHPWSSNGQFFSIRRYESGTSNYEFNRTLGNFPQYNQEARHGNVGMRELPIWVRLQRVGNVITSYNSPDGKIWSAQTVPQKLGDAPLPETMLVGLAVSGMSGSVSTTVYDSVSASNDVLLPGPSNVDATPSRNDNEVLVTFTGVPNATSYTIYRQAVGDSQYTKAGSTTNLTWFIDNGPDGKGLPAGTNYRYIVTATMPQNVETAGSYPARVSVGPISSPIGPFNSYDIGTTFQGNTTLDDKGVLTIQASGNGIGYEGDGLRFVGTQVRGDITMTAQILQKPASANKDGMVAAGLMVRESLDPAARNGFIAATTADNPDDQHAVVELQWRKHFSNTADDSLGNTPADGDPPPYPFWLRITRRGIFDGGDSDTTKIEGFFSKDGTNFTKIGGDDGGVTLDRLNPLAYVGFAVTSHQDAELATAKFDANSVKFQ